MPKTYLLDTDICSYVIKNQRELADAFISRQNDDICISVITCAELLYGVKNSGSRRIETEVRRFLSLVNVLDWNEAAAKHYADIKDYLKKNGAPIGNMDMLIAAAARATNAPLVTNNKKHFSLVPGLTIAEWP
jgi:tRNA(fMet)-specific endonuclease VapC